MSPCTPAVNRGCGPLLRPGRTDRVGGETLRRSWCPSALRRSGPGRRARPPDCTAGAPRAHGRRRRAMSASALVYASTASAGRPSCSITTARFISRSPRSAAGNSSPIESAMSSASSGRPRAATTDTSALVTCATRARSSSSSPSSMAARRCCSASGRRLSSRSASACAQSATNRARPEMSSCRGCVARRPVTPTANRDATGARRTPPRAQRRLGARARATILPVSRPVSSTHDR